MRRTLYGVLNPLLGIAVALMHLVARSRVACEWIVFIHKMVGLISAVSVAANLVPLQDPVH